MHTLREPNVAAVPNGMNGGLMETRMNGHHNNGNGQQQAAEISCDDVKKELEDNPGPEVDIILNNVVCNFSVRCHLNLKQIAMNGLNVEFHREMAV
jgi:TATA-box binding protein (TBP) (component of TFIID and TFIIIB)